MVGLEIGRILHILGVVFWIGGVAFVTTIILPAIKKFKSAEEAIEFFEKIEQRFSIQVKLASLITGLSGFYMISKLKVWGWFLDPSYWWMWAMVIVWLIFTLMPFSTRGTLTFETKRKSSIAFCDSGVVPRALFLTFSEIKATASLTELVCIGMIIS